MRSFLACNEHESFLSCGHFVPGYFYSWLHHEPCGTANVNEHLMYHLYASLSHLPNSIIVQGSAPAIIVADCPIHVYWLFGLPFINWTDWRKSHGKVKVLHRSGLSF